MLKIVNEFGDPVGIVWYRPSMMSYSWKWLNLPVRNGWTLEGIRKWADRLGYQLIDNSKLETLSF